VDTLSEGLKVPTETVEAKQPSPLFIKVSPSALATPINNRTRAESTNPFNDISGLSGFMSPIPFSEPSRGHGHGLINNVKNADTPLYEERGHEISALPSPSGFKQDRSSGSVSTVKLPPGYEADLKMPGVREHVRAVNESKIESPGPAPSSSSSFGVMSLGYEPMFPDETSILRRPEGVNESKEELAESVHTGELLERAQRSRTPTGTVYSVASTPPVSPVEVAEMEMELTLAIPANETPLQATPASESGGSTDRSRAERLRLREGVHRRRLELHMPAVPDLHSREGLEDFVHDISADNGLSLGLVDDRHKRAADPDWPWDDAQRRREERREARRTARRAAHPNNVMPFPIPAPARVPTPINHRLQDSFRSMRQLTGYPIRGHKRASKVPRLRKEKRVRTA
jgi:hypothetical protein